MRGYVDTNTHTCTHARRYKHTCACTHTNNSHMSVYTFVEPGTEAHPSLITSYEVPILANYLKWTMIGQFWYNISSHEINKEIPDKDRNKEIEIYCRLSTSTMFFCFTRCVKQIRPNPTSKQRPTKSQTTNPARSFCPKTLVVQVFRKKHLAISSNMALAEHPQWKRK